VKSGCHVLVAADGTPSRKVVIGDVNMPRVRRLAASLGMATRADDAIRLSHTASGP